VARVVDRVQSDFHLVESTDGWTLTISLSSRMLDALMGDGTDDANSPAFTVHVEPNLVSGDPFDARVVIVRPPV
jgi:hypothetical protein